MSGCSNCSNCSGCGGCGASLLLTVPEAELLRSFASLPFQPVVRKPDRELAELPGEDQGLVLACLEKKGLIDIDCHARLRGFDYSAYPGWLWGSMALTARGQDVLDAMDYQGVGQE